MKKSHRGGRSYNRDREMGQAGARVADRVVVLMIRVQQNARGGKDPDL
ncbi:MULTISPECIES: hypothetical protein [Paenibacillus]|uniref:Uncharacterized protein n=1 Tax=Paenibacillus residui TaxID=629724 RepID=A0ABW3DHG6_9BACL|nr:MULTISPECIES: hypothetical protein [Paenibacillus]